MIVVYERRRYVPRWLMRLFGIEQELQTSATYDLSAIYGMPVSNLDDAAFDEMNTNYLADKPFHPKTAIDAEGRTHIVLQSTLIGEIQFPVGTKPPEWKEPEDGEQRHDRRGVHGGGGDQGTDGRDREGGDGTPPDAGE